MHRTLAVGVGVALWCAACGGTDGATEVEPAVEPDAEPAIEPVVEPAVEPVVEPAPEPARERGQQPVTEAQIRGLLAWFVDDEDQSAGIVVGVTTQEGRVVVGYGRLSADDPTQPDGDTVFEIGSVTKVLTSTLLADLVVRGEMELDTPVQSLLGAAARMPTRDGAEITLGHLATHNSGLPRLPDNFDPADESNPYADYDAERLYAFLSSHELRRDIGEGVEYSNVGYGLLGHALALREGTDYETLVTERILEPLQMSDTAVELAPPLRERLVPGHDEQLRPAANWDLTALAGAGALRSTVNDMLTFVEANMGLRESALRPAMEFAQAPQLPDPALGMDLGLGWIIAAEGGRRFVWHNGATGGYSSFVGFDPEAREGVIVLSNSANLVDFVAYRLFTRDFG